MERIKDGRRNIFIHGSASADDLPVEGLRELPQVPNGDGFTARNMDEPKLYPGDVIIGVYDDTIHFAELVYDRVPTGVIVYSLSDGVFTLHEHANFDKRFYNADEFHVFGGVAETIEEWDVEFDVNKLERSPTSRPR